MSSYNFCSRAVILTEKFLFWFPKEGELCDDLKTARTKNGVISVFFILS